eukprot:6492005-Amphidinium_carterae.4
MNSGSSGMHSLSITSQCQAATPVSRQSLTKEQHDLAALACSPSRYADLLAGLNPAALCAAKPMRSSMPFSVRTCDPYHTVLVYSFCLQRSAVLRVKLLCRPVAQCVMRLSQR